MRVVINLKCNLNQEKLSEVSHKYQFVSKSPADFQCLRFNSIAPLRRS